MNRRLVISGILMLFLPLLTLIQGLFSKDVQYKRWIIIFFIAIYGSVINVAPGSDGFSHLSRVESYYTALSFPQFLKDIIDILTFTLNDNLKGDLYIHLISYLVAGVLGTTKLFFVFVSFIYAYFYTGALFRIIKLTPKFRYSWLFYGFLTVFVLWKTIEGINTVRTWTGLWVLMYACVSFYETKKFKYFILMFVPPLIHVGWFVMAMPAWFVTIFGTWSRTYSVLFFISFAFNILNPSTVTEQLEESELGANKVKGYYVEEEMTTNQKLTQSRERGSRFYKAYSKAGLNAWAVNTLAIVVILGGYYNKKMTFLESQIFSIGLLTKVLSSSTWFLFALSNRSSIASGLFLMAAFILMAQRGLFNDENGQFKKFEKYALTIIFLFMVPYILLKLSELFDFCSLFLISSPFIVWFSAESNISMKEGLKVILGM
jgi:hypothetical protein